MVTGWQGGKFTGCEHYSCARNNDRCKHLGTMALHKRSEFVRRPNGMLISTWLPRTVVMTVLEAQVQDWGLPRARRQCMLDATLPAPKVLDSDDKVSSFGGDCSENDQDAQKRKLGHDTEIAQLSCVPFPCWILAPKLMRFWLRKNMQGTMAANICTQ